MCHRFRGLARVDEKGAYRLFYVDETLFSRGPHARVTCTGCHADISKIPHDHAQPVDCLRNCHIQEPTREIIFTHAAVETGLKGSVHAPMDANNVPREHPEDLPQCKDCHDIPLFRPVSIFKSMRAGVSERAVHRCTQCHTDEKFVRYFYSHVTTRLHKARDPREVVAMCGTCHADPAFAQRHGLPDVVSSYLETYHGKAVLFGSAQAPDCLDCHSREGNVHEMHAQTDPRSSDPSGQSRRHLHDSGLPCFRRAGAGHVRRSCHAQPADSPARVCGRAVFRVRDPGYPAADPDAQRPRPGPRAVPQPSGRAGDRAAPRVWPRRRPPRRAESAASRVRSGSNMRSSSPSLRSCA